MYLVLTHVVIQRLHYLLGFSLQSIFLYTEFLFSAPTQLFDDRKDTRLVKKMGGGLLGWWWRLDWNFESLIIPAVDTTSKILSSNKIQNADILVVA